MSSSKTRVAVLRGGTSPEYEISLQTGGYVLKNLPEKYQGIDVFIDKSGVWHVGGLPKSPDVILRQSDVVFNALHGGDGKDGRIQQILQAHGAPFTGSKSFSSALGMNKVLSKNIFIKHGLKTPQFATVSDHEDRDEKIAFVYETIIMPAVVKPASTGSSVGVSIVSKISELKEAVERALAHSPIALIEEFIQGKEAACGVIEEFRGEPLYVLMPTEVRPKKGSFFDYNSKYDTDSAEEITPGNFSINEKKIIGDFARRAHQALGLRHYSRSGFIISPKRGVYILETNTLPGLTEASLFPKALAASGIPSSHFIDHVLTLALQ